MAINDIETFARIETKAGREEVQVRLVEVTNRSAGGTLKIDVRKNVLDQGEGGFSGFTREGVMLSIENAELLQRALDKALAEASKLTKAKDAEKAAPAKKAAAPVKKATKRVAKTRA